MAAKKKAAIKGKKPVKTASAKPTKSPAAKASRPAAATAAKKKAAPKPAPAKADPSAEAEALSRKIVRFTTSNAVEDHIDELYTDDCFSVEATGDAVQGRDGIAAKLEQWNQMTESSSMKPRNVVVKRNVIVIEWEGEVKLRDGRTVALAEVAVHEVRAGKICAERYYYDPSVFSGQARPELPPEPLPPVQPPRGTPPVDPYDL